MKQLIRIASGQGFWGDLLTAPVDQVTKGPIDYLVMDYLAEVTMSILQKQRRKDARLGYARDLIPLLEKILPICVERNIKVITNGGGVNPGSCSEAILEVARKLGIKTFAVGVVTGDDILNRLPELSTSGTGLRNMETNEPVSDVIDRLESANVYFGAQPIVQALSEGAQIIVTGRTTDTGLTLAPMIHEFGWSGSDWNRLAAGTIAGHILECGAQSSGGNFSADWRSVPDLAHVGFPIAEAFPDGTVVITKHDKTGGAVTLQTVKEQLVYEIGDPRQYITPDCIADFTSLRLSPEGKDRVRVVHVKGSEATPFYKVSMAYRDGFSAFGTLTYSWPDALEKAKAADQILRTRLADLGLHFDEIRSEYLGYDSCHGPLAGPVEEPNEVLLRIGVRGPDQHAVERFGMELAPLVLTGPPGVTGFAGGRPKPKEVISYWPALVPKSAVIPKVTINRL
jgi:hypothetical protein